jgi:hypothetical protein
MNIFRAMMTGLFIGFFSSAQLALAAVTPGEQAGGTQQNQATYKNTDQSGDKAAVIKAETEGPKPPDCSVANIIDSFKNVKPAELIDFSVRAAAVKKPVKEIQLQLKAGGYLTDQVDGIFGPQTYHALARLCRYLAAEGLLKPQEPVEGAASSARVAASSLAVLLIRGLEQTENELGQISKISLDAGDCGCSRDFSALSYGFLPYWLADGSARVVDYSVLDRIGFHGLQLKDGKIVNDSRWSEDSDSGSYIARFISTAHRHRVKVDVTFYSADWMKWDTDKIGNAVKAISKSIRQEFRDDSRGDGFSAVLERLLRKLLPFVEDNSTVRADGINLYFDSYENASDAPRLREIVETLAKNLQRKRPDAQINIMLGLKWPRLKVVDKNSKVNIEGIDKQLFIELEDILVAKSGSAPDAESDTDMIENVFVFLPQNTEKYSKNTSYSKKLLRRTIEDAFDGKGANRRTVLRKTVPIISTLPDEEQHDYFSEGEQFVEDLIYLQDNFAGVGLWPLPMEPRGDDAKDEASQDEATENEAAVDGLAESDAGAIGARLIEVYGAGTGSGLLDAEIEFFRQKLCEFACPNRWLFRIAFDFLAALLVVYALLAVWNCKLRKFYQRRFPYFLAYVLATSMIFGVSLACDPFWIQRGNFVMLATIVLLVTYIGVRYIGRAKRPRMP